MNQVKYAGRLLKDLDPYAKNFSHFLRREEFLNSLSTPRPYGPTAQPSYPSRERVNRAPPPKPAPPRKPPKPFKPSVEPKRARPVKYPDLKASARPVKPVTKAPESMLLTKPKPKKPLQRVTYKTFRSFCGAPQIKQMTTEI